jgi:hypothetical protein
MANRQKISLLLLAVAIFGIIGSTAVSADYTTTRYISTGQEISFLLHGSDGETVKVYYYPREKGTRKFEASHNTVYYWDKVAAMTFSWTDNGGQTWHEWRSAPVGYYWPKVKQDLYSGSSNIGYKFEFKILPAPCQDFSRANCNPPDALSIYVKIT